MHLLFLGEEDPPDILPDTKPPSRGFVVPSVTTCIFAYFVAGAEGDGGKQ